MSGDEKVQYARRHKYRLFIEDKYETVIQLANVCEKVYLLDNYYNQGELPDNVLRAYTWADITNDLFGGAEHEKQKD